MTFKNVSVLLVFSKKAAFKHFQELHSFALSNVASIDTRDSLIKHFGRLRFAYK